MTAITGGLTDLTVTMDQESSPNRESRVYSPALSPTRLAIVLPALNEEEAIGSTLARCLAARETILAQTPVEQIELIVVSDGSTDRTAQIARGFTDVRVIEFARNRGYGAAIMEGWRQSQGDLLAFLDADGTCDPKQFIPLINTLLADDADVVLGSRMGPDSQMPRMRRVGNVLFAGLLGALSQRRVTDSASGMRVVRRTALPKLLPLPVGLDFTPSMSARVLMDRGLKLSEVPMPYAERIGRSKLSVVKDGLRFAREIFSAAAYVRPSRITLPIAVGLLLICATLALQPTLIWLKEGMLPEWMIYRFLTILLLAIAATSLLCATVVAEHAIAVARIGYEEFLTAQRGWWGRRALRMYWRGGILMLLAGTALVLPGAIAFLRTGHITPEQLHWSRVVVGLFCAVNFLQMTATACLLRILAAVSARQRFMLDAAPTRCAAA